ncbi:Regulator of RpoS [Paenibacillus sp. JJ-100]|uniref:response regulator n=1 Tax=Paenibacillus sp. JJ-100 TaxID=2974896 RepID=UPI0022FF9642|nr:response regulator [Paenibacillus sp. JJ-100]CAI6044834.1 Regulator of RpoS [Paenibacillus sp. JJ-100]
MLKVLLVDDEMYIRRGMYELIDWHSMGMEITGEAENGLEALDKAECLKPDIIITDIRMPILDGLDLIRAVEHSGTLEPVFIIISGYHDFKYAQQAIRYGVQDYILKPIDDEEMTATLQKAADLIRSKRKHSFLAEEEASRIMLKDLLKGQIQKEDEIRYAEMIGIGHQTRMMIALVELQTGLKRRNITVHQVNDILHKIKDDRCELYVLEEQRNRMVLILLWKHPYPYGSVEEKIQTIQKMLSDHLEIDIALYAGTVVDHMTEVARSYAEAEEAYRHKFAESERIVYFAAVKDKTLYVFNVNQELIDQLILCLEERNRTACHTIVDDMFHLFQSRRFSPQAVTGSLLRCITGILAVVHEMGGTDTGLQQLRLLAEQGQEGWNLRLLKEAFLKAIEEAEEYMAQLRTQQSKGEIHKIKRYIDSHYTENISLKSIAAQFYMNPVYLGRLFRKSYNQYFNEYLLHLRIQQAQKLLRQTDLRMYEVAARIGFQNADYFVTQFEKIVHMTPTAYRNLLKEDGQRGAQ